MIVDRRWKHKRAFEDKDEGVVRHGSEDVRSIHEKGILEKMIVNVESTMRTLFQFRIGPH